MTLNAGTASALNLKTIETATLGLVDAQSITAISGKVDDVKSIINKQGWVGDSIRIMDSVQINLTDIGSISDIDFILKALNGVVTTCQLTTGLYENFAANDKISTGLTFTNHTSQTIGPDGDINWNWNSSAHTLTFESSDSGTTNSTVMLQLAGIMQVQEINGIFTLLTMV